MGQPQFLYLTTKGWKTRKQHKIEIWFVELNGRYYVVSEHMERSHWVQNIVHEPRVSFRVGDRESHGAARIVDTSRELALVKDVSKLMDSKYGWSQGLIVELAPS